MKIITCIFVAFVIFKSVHAQVKLDITIVDLKNDNGIVRVELIDANHASLLKKTSTIQKGQATLVFDNLQPGKYAIQYYHDENLNDKLDMNLFKIPTEGYGFSNDAYSMFGPKSFDQWLVNVVKDAAIVMKTKN
jgi:uncharacterized protein (DUF2141 family)